MVLYDADRVLEAASTADQQRLYQAQRGLLLDPRDPAVVGRGGGQAESPQDWIEAASRSPLYKLIARLPDGAAAAPGVPDDADGLVRPAAVAGGGRAYATPGTTARTPGNLFGAIDALRIPIDYLAELFTAGDPAPVRAVLARLAAMRSYMRDINLGREPTRPRSPPPWE